jgi:PAS domain S-box-containing protein
MQPESLSHPHLLNLLHETEERLRMTALELSELRKGVDEAVIVSISNLRGEIIHANAMMAKITGYPLDEIIGKSHRLFNSGFHTRAFFKDLWDTVLCGKIWKGEIRNKRKDGSFFWVDTTIVPFADRAGRVYQFMSIRKDITDRKLAEERAEKERASREFAGRLAAIGEMASNIAHEIRNPLGAIIMRADLTKLDLDPGSENAKAMDQIIRLGHRIDKIINGVRMLSRDGSGDPFEQTPLSSLITETLEMLAGKFENSGVQVRAREVPQDIHIRCRPVQISQVLANLINNAFDAVQGRTEMWIELKVEKSGERVMISVSDSGGGIPPEIEDKIMQPYFTTKPLGKGTGLGLSISREIVAAHGGELKIDKTNPHTTFLIELPAAPSIVVD